jgi:hypothetical protein
MLSITKDMITLEKKDVEYTTSYFPSLLSKKKDKINNNNNIYLNDVIINSLDIADGLKDLLTKYRFTLEELLTIPSSGLSEVLGIDEYIARMICNAAKHYVMADTPRKTLQTVNGI